MYESGVGYARKANVKYLQMWNVCVCAAAAADRKFILWTKLIWMNFNVVDRESRGIWFVILTIFAAVVVFSSLL